MINISHDFKDNLISFISNEINDNFIVLDSCNYKKDKYSSFDFLIAFGEQVKENRSLDKFYLFNKEYESEWKFGYFSYDLKNEIKELQSKNKDYIKFPNLSFFVAKNIFIIKDEKLIIEKTDIHNIEEFINKIKNYKKNSINTKETKLFLNNRITREKYLESLKKIKDYIKKGDIYLMNYCQEFYLDNVDINPLNIFIDLKNKIKSPFSCFFKIDNRFIISLSPERFLKKIDTKIISQPIKGTSKRSKNLMLDFLLKRRLKRNKKEISENTMTVDLVRNDLGIIAKKGNVKVEEYAKVYTFENIHQLISTIVCEVDDKKKFNDIFEATFPIASMTGTPKYRAIQIIDELETVKRGVYSGSIGYIKPNGDFDFNVVIRTLLYDKEKKYLSFMTGGAITYKSINEKEYEECIIKLKSVLNNVQKNI